MNGTAIITTDYASEIERAQEITTALFNDFVTFIDRSERTARAYLTNLKQFMAWLRYTATVRPQRQDIITYRDWLGSEHEAISFTPETAKGYTLRTDGSGSPLRISCRPATVKAYLQSVKMFFSWTGSNGIYPNIAANVHLPKVSTAHRKDGLTAEEVLTVETSIADHAAQHVAAAAEQTKDTAGRIQRSTEQGLRLNAMYLLAVNAGLRTVEISRANVKDLETKSGRTFLYIWGKGHTEADQRKALAPEVAAAIREYLDSRTDSYTGSSPLFVSTGNRSGGQRLATTTISTMLKGALQVAGFDSDRLTAHSLRHAAAQNVMQITGDNIYTTQKYLRHASPTTTEVYLADDEAEQEATVADQLYRYYHGAATEADKKEELQAAAAGLTPEQIQTLTELAKAMQRK